MRAPADNRTRNAAIVAACAGGVLIACPAGAEGEANQQRSGTWQTIRMARSAGRGALVISPNGTMAAAQVAATAT